MRAAGAEASPDVSRIGADAALVAEVAEASVTRLDDDCTDPVVEGSVQVSGGRSQDRERFLAAAAAAGLGTGSGPVVALVPPRGLRAAGDDPGDPAGVAGQADVVVTLGEPFGLAQVGPEQVPIAAYDDSAAAISGATLTTLSRRSDRAGAAESVTSTSRIASWSIAVQASPTNSPWVAATTSSGRAPAASSARSRSRAVAASATWTKSPCPSSTFASGAMDLPTRMPASTPAARSSSANAA